MKNKGTKLVKIPKLRFPGFNSLWNESQLGNLIHKAGEKNKDSIKYPIYSINNKEGFLPQQEQFTDVDSNKRGYDISMYKIIKEKTFAYNPARINVGSIGYSADLSDIMISSLYVCFTTKKCINDIFLNFYFDTIKFSNSVSKFTEGGVREYLFFENFCKIIFSYPELKEQEKITSFLSSVDEKIEKLKTKKLLLEQYKKGVMQQIFNQEIRFRDEHGKEFPKWKETKLGEVATFFKGRSISKNDIDQNGVTECIRYGELYTLYGETINTVFSKTNIPKNELFLSKKNDLIMPSSGETHLDIARASCVCKEGVALGGDINVIRTNQDNIFLAYYLNNAKKHDLAKLAQGFSVVHLYSSRLEGLKIKIPSEIKEQSKIASFLTEIDSKIEITRSQIEQAEQWEKGLLQGMFV